MTGNFRRGGLQWHLDLNEGFDFSIFLLGAVEPSTVRFYKKVVRKGDVILDIGANIGGHTLPFAQCVAPHGKVIAFEPTAFAYQKLVDNLSLNPDLSEVVIANHMLLTAPGDQHIPSEVYSSWPLKPSGEVHPKHLGQLRSLGAVRIDTVDSYCASNGVQRLDWIKIDVDGNEISILEGASETIGRFRPRLIMELSPYQCREAGHSFESLLGLLRRANYNCYDLETRRELSMQPRELESTIPDGASLNVFLKPAKPINGAIDLAAADGRSGERAE